MKKLLALLLCLVMIVSVFAGCGPTGNGGKTTDGADTTTGGALDGTLPDDITITIGIPEVATVEDYDTNALTLWIEEETGYDLQFVRYLPSPADYKAKLSTALVNGDPLPDVLIGFQLNRSYYQDLGDDGYIIDLAPFFEDKEGKAKIWWDRLATLSETQQEQILANLYDDDGADEIWSFPVIEQSDFDVMDHQMLINQEWLTTLNLEMPTDPDSLYNVLKAFKTRDPNGNGKADEIPLIGKVDGLYGDPIAWIINMFVYNDYDRPWRVDENGKLYQIYDTDKYREALIYIRKLVDEGLMDVSCWGLSGEVIKSLMAPIDGVATVGIAGMHCASWPMDTALLYQYASMPYWGYATLTPNRLEWWSFITEDCEYPEAVWNIFMLMSTEEGGYRSRYGEKGVDWDDADEGTKSFLDRDARIKVMNTDATANGVSNWAWMYFGILTNSENEVTQVSDDLTEWNKYRYNMMAEQYKNFYEAAARTPDNVVNALRFTVEEEEEIATDRVNVETVIAAARASFCTGKSSDGKYTNPSDDTQWEAYKQEILAQGYENWKEMAQVVYDETYANAE